MSQTHTASTLLPSPQITSPVQFPLVEWILYEKLVCDKAKLLKDRNLILRLTTCTFTPARRSESSFHPRLWSWFSAHCRGLGQASIRHNGLKQIETWPLGRKRHFINTLPVQPIDRTTSQSYKHLVLIMTPLSDLEC